MQALPYYRVPVIRPLPTSSITKFKRSVWTSQISATIQLFQTWTNRYLNLVPLGSKHEKSWTNLGHKIAKLNTMFKTDKNLTPTYVQNSVPDKRCTMANYRY